AQKELPSWDVLQMEFATSLLALIGPPSILKTKAGSVPYDLAELFKEKVMRVPIDKIMTRYNEIYAQEKAAAARAEVRTAPSERTTRLSLRSAARAEVRTPQDFSKAAQTVWQLQRKWFALTTANDDLRDRRSDIEAAIRLNRQTFGDRDTEFFLLVLARIQQLDAMGRFFTELGDHFRRQDLSLLMPTKMVEMAEPVLQQFEARDLAAEIFSEFASGGTVTSDMASKLAGLTAVGLDDVIHHLEEMLRNAQAGLEMQVKPEAKAYITASMALISKVLGLIRALSEESPEGATVGLSISDGADDLEQQQWSDQHAHALASLGGLIQRMIVIGRLPAQFQTMLDESGYSGFKLTLEGSALNVKAPDGQAWVPVVEVGDGLSGTKIPPEILRVLLEEEGYKQDDLSFYTLSAAVALQYAYSVMAALQLKKNMAPSEISEKLLAQLGLTAENPFVMDGDKMRVMVNLVQGLITEFQARSEIRKSA
nr:hypothetical protein [Candidatus Omnitrophota bacterium]